MDIAKEDILVKRFPDLLRGYFDPPEKSCLYWGFEHENGWFKLVYDMLLEMETMAGELEADVEILQVKNKFGILTVYVDGPQEIQRIATKYQERSRSICERCGEPGVLRKNGWWMTLCDKDNQEFNHPDTRNWKK